MNRIFQAVDHRIPPRIMIVVNEAIIAADLKNALTSLGFEVCANFTSAELTIELLEKDQPDLVILDINPSGRMDGIEAAKIIRHKYGLPLVFLTTYAGTAELERAGLTFPFGYMLKPFNQRDLKITVEMALYVSKADRERRLAEKRLELAMNATQDGIWDWDIKNEKVYRSDAVYKMLGYERGVFPVSDEDWLSIVHQDDVQLIRRTIQDHFDNKTNQHSYEYRLRGKDGRIVWFLSRGETISRDADGRPTRMVGTYVDITQKKLLENELKSALYKLQLNEQRLRLGVASSNIAVFHQDRDLRYTWICQPQLGYLTGQVLGKTDKELLAEPTATEVMQIKRTVMETGLKAREEVKLAHNGQVYYYDLRVEPLHDEQNNTIGISGSSLDITERKHIEGTLRRERELFEFALETSFLGAWDLDLVDHTAVRTIQHDRIFGYSQLKSTWTYEEFLEHVLPEDRDMVDRKFHQAVKTEGDLCFECRIRRIDGQVRWIWVVGRPRCDHVDSSYRMSGIVQDITDRKKAQKALEDSSERLHFALQAANAGVWEWDLASGRNFWSEEIWSLYGLGHKVAEPSYDLWRETVDPEDRESIERIIGEAVTNHKEINIEYRVNHPDGTVHWLMSRGKPLYNGQGKPIRYLGIIIDITERKQAEEALRESRAKLQAALASMNDAVFISDTEGRFIDFNEASATFHRFKNKDECATTLAEYPDIIDVFLADGELAPLEKWAVPRALRGETVTNAEYKLRRKDTGETWVGSYSFGPIRNDSGAIVGSVVVGRDITESRMAEEALRESRDYLENLINYANAPIIVWDPQFRIVRFNRAFETLTGRNANEVIGKHLEILFPQALTQSSMDLIKKAVSGERLESVEIRILTIAGDTRIVVWNSATIFAADGTTPMATVAQGYDVTEYRRELHEKEKLQRKLTQAQKMEAIGTLAGGIAHDFNNILGAILGNTQLALLEPQGPGENRHFLEQIYKAGQRATDLVKHILSFSRQTEQPQVHVQVAPLIKEALKLIRASIPSTIEIKQNLRADYSGVLADPTSIHQIIINLCTNAAHAMAEQGGILTVGIEAAKIDSEYSGAKLGVCPGNYVKLSVTDTGHGIRPEHMDRIFDPYFTTKSVGEGTGLGLAVIHGIVQNLQGGIDVYSEPGRGTTFNIYLPVIDFLPSTTKTPTETLEGGTERILFVDDETALAEIGQKQLEWLGYQVTTRSSSGEALELFKNRPYDFDLVITDQTMPQMTGTALAAELIKIRPEIPIILCSGYSHQLTEKKVLEIGIKKFLFKPLLIHDMAKTIREILRTGNRRE